MANAAIESKKRKLKNPPIPVKTEFLENGEQVLNEHDDEYRDQSDFDDNFEEDVEQYYGEEEEDGIIQRKHAWINSRGQIDPFELAHTVVSTPEEYMPLLHQDFSNATRGFLKFDTSSLDNAAASCPDPHMKNMYLLQRQQLFLLEHLHCMQFEQKDPILQTIVHKDEIEVKLRGKDSNKVAESKVDNFYGTEKVVLNDLFSTIKHDGSLKSAIHYAARFWIQNMIPKEWLLHMTVSTKSVHGFRKMPERFLDPAADFILKLISFKEASAEAASVLKESVRRIFKDYCRNRFNSLRSEARKLGRYPIEMPPGPAFMDDDDDSVSGILRSLGAPILPEFLSD